MRLYENQSGGTIDRARDLRGNAPEPERRSLRALRQAFPHLKWRHQAPVGHFYTDILCFSEHLVIEVDDTHGEKGAYNTRRTAFIEHAGLKVFRVANTDVMQNLEGVLARISFSLREKEGASKTRKDAGERAQEKGAPA